MTLPLQSAAGLTPEVWMLMQAEAVSAAGSLQHMQAECNCVTYLPAAVGSQALGTGFLYHFITRLLVYTVAPCGIAAAPLPLSRQASGQSCPAEWRRQQGPVRAATAAAGPGGQRLLAALGGRGAHHHPGPRPSPQANAGGGDFHRAARARCDGCPAAAQGRSCHPGAAQGAGLLQGVCGLKEGASSPR